MKLRPTINSLSEKLIVIWAHFLLVSEEDRILKALEKLDRLKRMGLIDEKYYREKRDFLLSKYLEVSGEKLETVEEYSQPQHGEGKKLTRILPILLLVIAVMLIGMAIGNIIHPFIKVPTHTTTLTIEKPITTTKEYWYTIMETLTVTETIESPVMFYNRTYIYESPLNIPMERVIYSGSLYLEQGCEVKGFSINTKKGDLIEVYWEADDDDAYIAIGTPAHYAENVKSGYCETAIAFWKYSWPAADYGYSGSLRFTVPSSGTWYVVVANGNYHCIFSECPITITKLEIKHVEVS